MTATRNRARSHQLEAEAHPGVPCRRGGQCRDAAGRGATPAAPPPPAALGWAAAGAGSACAQRQPAASGPLHQVEPVAAAPVVPALPGSMMAAQREQLQPVLRAQMLPGSRMAARLPPPHPVPLRWRHLLWLLPAAAAGPPAAVCRCSTRSSAAQMRRRPLPPRAALQGRRRWRGAQAPRSCSRRSTWRPAGRTAPAAAAAAGSRSAAC